MTSAIGFFTPLILVSFFVFFEFASGVRKTIQAIKKMTLPINVNVS